MLNIHWRRPCRALVNCFFPTRYVIKENDMMNLSVVILLCFTCIKQDSPERIVSLKTTCLWFGVTYIAD